MSNVSSEASVEKRKRCVGMQRISDPGEGQHKAEELTENKTDHMNMALQRGQ